MAYVDGDEVGRTRTLSDSCTPERGDTFTVTLAGSSELAFRFHDEDGFTAGDFGGEHVVSDLSVAIEAGGRGRVGRSASHRVHARPCRTQAGLSASVSRAPPPGRRGDGAAGL